MGVDAIGGNASGLNRALVCDADRRTIPRRSTKAADRDFAKSLDGAPCAYWKRDHRQTRINKIRAREGFAQTDYPLSTLAAPAANRLGVNTGRIGAAGGDEAVIEHGDGIAVVPGPAETAHINLSV